MLGPGRQERSWIRGAQGGSASDLEALFKEHWPRAHRAAYLVVQDGAAAEDIAQEAFLSAIRNLDRFDRRRPFGPWLHRIVVNRCLDLLRTERRLVGGEAELERLEWHDVPSGDQELLDAIAGLSLQRRVVVVLRYGLGYTPTAIGELLGIPIGTVNSRLARALEELRADQEVSDAGRA